MNCPSETCAHELAEQRKRVTPPKHVNFEIRFNRCSVCGDIQATPEQRKKNTKHSNYAYNKCKEQRTSLWGIQ
jgi:hypothetical protein